MPRTRLLISILISVLLFTGCSLGKPPLSWAPDNKIVTKAIAVSLTQAEQGLSEQLTTSLPELEIAKVQIKQLEPLYLGKLPTYHLQGSYSVTLRLSDDKMEKQQNEFDLYLQRQIEGKTWRLVKEEPDSHQWLSYSLGFVE